MGKLDGTAIAFIYLNCGFLPRSSGDWLVPGAYALTRKRLTGRLCWSMVVGRVARIRGPNARRSEPARSRAYLASGPKAMATPRNPRGNTFVASPCSRSVMPSFYRASLPAFHVSWNIAASSPRSLVRRMITASLPVFFVHAGSELRC